ncbi:glycosyltransferase family 2 protein [Demequina aestuarii]|uniref:glycosyltransferase family 2 protein n=1 Tax=Demequina aestuarii TaxID=327095 RepID=UPI000A02996A|nr:glycosyltransferase [Demequina aestuarii]
MAAKRKDSASPSAVDGDATAETSPVGEVAERAPAPARKRPLTSTARRRRSVKEPADLRGAAALIVAHNEARRIAATVRAARAIPGVDLVLVVDDASGDNTQELARKAGAVVVRHSHHRGRTASVETGASVIAMRDEPGRHARAILLLPGGLGQHAIGAAPLVPAVTEHVADLAIALTEAPGKAPSASAKAARRAVERASGWVPTEPLGPIRCLTREALEAAIPLAHGGGLEVGMTIDVLRAGLTVTEVECEVRHKAQAATGRSAPARASQYRDVMMAVTARRVRGSLAGTRDAVGRRRTRALSANDTASAPDARSTSAEESQ